MTQTPLTSASALLALIVAAQGQTPAGDGRPPFSFLRQAEDWSAFRASPDSTDPFDPLKHVPLTKDGGTWVSFGGVLEMRIESWSDFGFAPQNDDSFIVSRAFAHADLHVGERFRFFVEGKSAQSTDRDLPGGRRDLDLDTLDLQQAFIDVTLPVGDGSLRLRPGRQMLLFGAQRLVSPLPWGNTLRTWEGLTAEWRNGPWSVTGLATVFVPVDKTDFNEAEEDVTLWGVYAKRAPAKGGHGLELFALGTGRPDVTINGTTGDSDRVTLGGRAYGPLEERFDYEVELAYQLGEVGDEDVKAWSLASQLGWKPEGWAGTPRFWAGLDAASGDDEVGGDVGTFDQLFPLGHAYFGFIDVIGRQNILDTSLGGKWSLQPATSLSLGLHSFRLMETADALYNAGGAATRTGFDSKEVGYEMDLTVDHRVGRHTTIHTGYSHFFTGDAIAESGPSQDIDFFHFGIRTLF